MPSASASADFGRHPDGAQQINHQPVPHAHPVGKCMAFLGEENAAVRARGRKAGALEPGDGFDGGGVGNAETAGDVGRPRLALARKKVRDQFGVILEQCR